MRELVSLGADSEPYAAYLGFYDGETDWSLWRDHELIAAMGDHGSVQWLRGFGLIDAEGRLVAGLRGDPALSHSPVIASGAWTPSSLSRAP